VFLFSLDDPPAVDLSRAGAKAARLAEAKRAGLPVLNGVVVDAICSQSALGEVQRLADEKGAGAARLAIMDVELPADLVPAISSMLPARRLVVRSSSPLEGSASWSGAFTSYVDVAPEDLAVAIRGCWASMFSRDVLARLERTGEHTAAGMAVLVQELIEPALGGVAEVGSGVVTVTVAIGELTGLLHGWCPGHSAVVPTNGEPCGPAVDNFGQAPMSKVALLARTLAERLGDDHIEWAMAGEICYVLQCRRRDPPENGSPPRRRAAGLRGELAAEVVRKVAHFGGASGDELVLPWCLGTDTPSDMHHRALDDDASDCGRPTIEWLRATSRSLAAQAWNTPPEQVSELANSVLWRLREGLDPEAWHSLSSLLPVDRNASQRLVRTVEHMATDRALAGTILDPADIWRLGPEILEQLLVPRAGDETGPGDPPRSTSTARRLWGPGIWEPFLQEVVLANGTVHQGVPASAGTGAGRLLLLGLPGSLGAVRERSVLCVKTPIPAYAPLLWGAAGLVSFTGDGGAHLFDVARSLGVPAVARVGSADLAGVLSGEVVGAVDGESGTLVVL
jgi:hypothetical protein